MRPWHALLALPLVACGANYRYAYDGESTFERCYALDYDPATTPPARQQCWSAWLQSYSFGAGADRVEYARARAVPQGMSTPAPALPTAAASAAANGAMTSTPGAAEVATPAAPATSRPPQVADAWQRSQISVGGNPIGAPRPTAAPDTPEAEPPGAACGHDCHTTWHTCGQRCTGSDAACVARCDDAYRDCMRGCF